MTTRHPEKNHRQSNPIPKKPDWIRVKAPTNYLFKETRDKIYGIRRDAKENAKKVEDKKSEQYKNKLLSLQKEFNLALEEAKDDKLIPQNTTIAKIGMLPAKAPKRWATTYNRIFGRKKVKAKVKIKIQCLLGRPY